MNPWDTHTGAEPPLTDVTAFASLVEAEKVAIRMGWIDQCPYVGIGPCVRAVDHDLPHLTDPSANTEGTS